MKNNIQQIEKVILVTGGYAITISKEIAKDLGIQGTSDYVRVSELKKQAVQKLIDNVDYTQVLDYL